MLRKKWTVYIGDWDCLRREDCHSEKDFDSARSCRAFMWAKANCDVPEKCWVSAGADGLDCNFNLAGKEPPKEIAFLVKFFIAEENALEVIARGIELPVQITMTERGNMLAYCQLMKCELIIKDVSELDGLADEYADLLEADYGKRPNVTLSITYPETKAAA